MTRTITCQCGHRWEASPDERNEFCPKCGEKVRAEAATNEGIAAEPMTVLPVLPRREWDDDDRPRPRRIRRSPPPPKSGYPTAGIVGIVSAVAFAGLFGFGVLIALIGAKARRAAVFAPPPGGGAEYYDDFVKRRGVPEGIGWLNVTQVRQAGFAVRITRNGNLVSKVEFVDGRLNPRTAEEVEEHFHLARNFRVHHPECSFTYTYNFLGEVQTETAFDHDGKELWKLTYTSPTSAVYEGNNAPFAPLWLGASHVRFTWSPEGWESEITFTDENGRPKANDEGVASIRKQHELSGFLRQQTFHDADGKAVVAPSRGYAGFQTIFDGRGWLTSLTALGPDLKPTKCRRGFATYRAENNLALREATFSYLDEQDNLVATHPEGYARQRQHFDNNGDLIDEHYFGVDGKPAYVNGHCGYRVSYDSAGNRNSFTCLDADDNLVRCNYGYAVERQTFDGQRRVIAQWYLDTKLEPVNCRSGYTRMAMQYDEDGHRTESAFFGPDGKPVLYDGHARWNCRYDSEGHVREYQYFGVDGELCLQAAGYARQTLDYDDAGRIRQEAYFGTDNKPVVAKVGYARVNRKYGMKYQLLEEEFFGRDGKPILGAQGYASSKSEFDNDGHLRETAYFGADGKPCVTKEGFSKEKWRYDDKGRLREMAWYGPDGKAVLVNGHAAIAYRYNERGAIIETRHLGIDGKLRAQKDGVACVAMRCDDRDRVIETIHFDAAEKLVAGPGGYARSVQKYGDGYQVLEEAYFGPDGKPVACKAGYARWTARYEEWRRVAQQFFDVAGRPVKTRVRVVRVEEGAPAEKAGLKAGDVLISYYGKPVTTVGEFEIEQSRQPQDETPRPLVVDRAGKSLTLQVAPGWWDEELEDFVPAAKPAKD